MVDRSSSHDVPVYYVLYTPLEAHPDGFFINAKLSGANEIAGRVICRSSEVDGNARLKRYSRGSKYIISGLALFARVSVLELPVWNGVRARVYVCVCMCLGPGKLALEN